MTTYLLIIMLIHICCGSYSYWSPDGIKDLWCPDTLNPALSTSETDKDCACSAKPVWQLPFSNVTYQPLVLETLDVEFKRTKVFNTTAYLLFTTYFSFTFTNSRLRNLPENSCDFTIVTIDVTNNIFSEISNLSCFSNLDTLIMKQNLITFVSNETFLGMNKLRIIDLSFNRIKAMDLNIVSQSRILSFNFESNYLDKLDISNIFGIKKTMCDVSYANNKDKIALTNENDFQLGENSPYLCNDLNFSNVSEVYPFPLTMVSKNISAKYIYLYAPCGTHRYEKSGFNCNCDLADFFPLPFKDLSRLYFATFSNFYCKMPENLFNISIYDAYTNQSMRDQMICEIQDHCHSKPGCQCRCISQPSRERLLVDCSNQSCTDFPQVIPLSKYDVTLLMNQNKIKHVKAREYFKRVNILDIAENPIENLDTDIDMLEKASEVRISNHSLRTLPKSISNLHPDVFRFLTKGIPCNCENRWIGEWRRYKGTSSNNTLYCSNFQFTLIEDVIDRFSYCESDSQPYRLFLFSIFVILLAWLMFIYKWYRHDFLILKRKITELRGSKHQKWETDLFISFDDDNDEVRYFILRIFEPFLKRNGISTYIPCRDDLFGCSREETTLSNMMKCKYIMIIQSMKMYNYDVNKSATIRRLEYKLAWDYFIIRRSEKILLINFDDSDFDSFQYTKSRSLHRFGMGFFINDRKKSLKDFILSNISDPLITNKKHTKQRIRHVKADLSRNVEL